MNFKKLRLSFFNIFMRRQGWPELQKSQGFLVYEQTASRGHLPFLACDHILSKSEIINLYGDVDILDLNFECWEEGINRIDQDIFEGYAKKLLNWIGDSYNKIFIISHDGTITNYQILLGEKGLTRKDFLGEAGVYQMTL